MRNINLKIALIIYGAIHIAQGIVLIVAPGWAAENYGFGELAPYMSYLLAIIGSAFIAAGVWFAMTGLDPLRKINGVRFAILWAGLLLAIQLYTLHPSYDVDISQIWPSVVLNAVFVAAFLIFYPYRRSLGSG
jgi:hypothetical protein